MKQSNLTQYDSRTSQHIIAVLAALMVCLPASPWRSTAHGGQPTLAAVQKNAAKSPEEIEYGIKAAFIYNFMKFVEWPEDKKTAQDQQQAESAPMVIGMLGDNPFKKAFSPILGKQIQGRAIQLVEIQGYQAFLRKTGDKQNALAAYQKQYQKLIGQCDVLFICTSEKDHIEPLLSIIEGKAVLTVSDLPEFSEKGGMIGFVKEKNKVRFEINLKAATRADIKVRSQLLSLARKIYKDKK